MEKQNVMDEINMLQYQIKRYQSLRKGSMVQALNIKLQKMMEQRVA